MWSEFRNLALICDQRCRRHARIRAWTIASGVVFLSTILIVVAKILCFDSVAAVSSSAPARSELFVGLAELPAADRHLLERARAVSRRAYAPYSGFGVGAAVRTRSGAVYAGANMENASYGLTLCAETSALLQTVAADDFAVEAIAIVGGRLDGAGGPGRPVTPCGRCRQLIVEAAQVANTDVRVIAANADLSRVTVRTIGELLPEAFGPRDLG
ncbi:cytidine deaminase [bacterium]|nr:cytidine deaminase [bacterium]